MTDIFIAIIVMALVVSIIAFFFLPLVMSINDMKHKDEWGNDDDSD